MAATVCQAQEELLAGFKICWPPKYVPSYHTWFMMSIERNVEIQGRHLTSSRAKNGKIGTKTHKSALKGAQLYYNIFGLDRAIT